MELQSERAVAEIDEAGGRLASLVIDGLEVLIAEGTKESRWGSFPMIPWCGRLPNGRLDFAGRTYDFPLNSPPHANHGRTHLQRWEPLDDTSLWTELVEPWPFGGHAVQRFELTDSHFRVTAEVHAGDRPMPAMAGWHPWFRRSLERGDPAELSFEAESVYSVDEALVPTGELEAVPPPPWNACFVGLSHDPVITWPGALSLTISSDFDHWVIFTEPDHALCVEPQSGPPNEFHLSPRILQPGEALIGAMTLGWTLDVAPS